MSDLTTDQRKKLKPSQFADPTNRAYPIVDKAHADAAASRLEGQKASMSPGKYASIKRRIKAAQRRFGEAPVTAKRTRRAMRINAHIPAGGSLHVRHMTVGDAPSGIFAVELKDATGDGPKWNQLARPGRYFKDGSFFELDGKVFSDIVRNFNASENKRVPVDFEHASELRGSDGSIPVLGAPAQGWITAVDLRADGLWGLIEWNDLAKQYIDGKNYRYLSPAIRFGCKDAHTGKDIGSRLTSTALTNVPFLDGLKQVAAKDGVMTTTTTETPVTDEALLALKGDTMCYSANEYMPRVRSMLKLPDLATAKMCKDHLAALRDHFDAAGGDHTASHEGVRLADYMMPMRDMVGAAMGTTWDDVFDVVDDMIDAAMDQHEIEDHSGEEPGDTTEEATMSETKELTIQLTDAKAEVITLNDKIAKADTEIAGLTLKLKDAESKTSEQTARAVALETEVQTLRDDAKKRADQTVAEKVEVAFLTYKDAKQLTDANKRAMVLTLKSDPALFEELYPAIDPSKRHLLRDVATGSKDPGDKSTVVASGIPDMRTLTLKFQKEGKTLEEATSLAYVETMKSVTGLSANATA